MSIFSFKEASSGRPFRPKCVEYTFFQRFLLVQAGPEYANGAKKQASRVTFGHFGVIRGSLLDTLGGLLYDLGYMRVTLEPLWSNFEKHSFSYIDFNDLMHLRGQLGVTLGSIFMKIMEDNGRKVKSRPQSF